MHYVLAFLEGDWFALTESIDHHIGSLQWRNVQTLWDFEFPSCMTRVKTISIEFKVVDGPLYYNLLLGRTLVYAMSDIISTYFHMIIFPHKGKILATDQLTFFAFHSHVTGTIPLLGETLHSYQHVGVGLLNDSSFMGTFSLPPPVLPEISPSITYINMISSSTTRADP